MLIKEKFLETPLQTKINSAKTSADKFEDFLNYLFGDNLDENTNALSYDENNLIIQIDEGVR